ncbi:MAG: site-specific DNA-methyltransferase [Victivallaceae bacterium]|nr:site-specific DNA-methyltransferase [Victivallaceae bacterium]
MTTADKKRAPRNRTLTLDDTDRAMLRPLLLRPDAPLSDSELADRVICADLMEAIDLLPDRFVDLLILDPPYNLDKEFNGRRFSKRNDSEYADYLDSWLSGMPRLLKPGASVYLCCDWHCSGVCAQVLEKYFTLRNRIVWQREKGRAAKSNWKNCTEDIWFATCGDDYFFDAGAVRQKRRVLAPYRENGKPRDWEESDGGKFRLTAASNFWDDISIPYWSMPENTDHPTQKPEKLIAKLILASSRPGDLVFDPFSGSGTTAVAARKLGRRFAAVERDEEFCLWTLARLQNAVANPSIQGYSDGVFWERNTQREQQQSRLKPQTSSNSCSSRKEAKPSK